MSLTINNIKIMKKFLILTVIGTMVSLCACNSKTETAPTEGENVVEETTVNEDTVVVDSTEVVELETPSID